jgi:hypothetical protein
MVMGIVSQRVESSRPVLLVLGNDNRLKLTDMVTGVDKGGLGKKITKWRKAFCTSKRLIRIGNLI